MSKLTASLIGILRSALRSSRVLRPLDAGMTQYLFHRYRNRWMLSQQRRGVHFWAPPTFRGRMPWDTHVDLGDCCEIEHSCTFWIGHHLAAGQRLSLGERVYVAEHCFFNVLDSISVGRNSMIGAYSYLVAGNHRFSDRQRPMREQGFETGPITLGENVWIGAHVILLPRVSIGNDSIVGAGSVVTKSIGPGEIWAGNPAKLIRLR